MKYLFKGEHLPEISKDTSIDTGVVKDHIWYLRLYEISEQVCENWSSTLCIFKPAFIKFLLSSDSIQIIN